MQFLNNTQIVGFIERFAVISVGYAVGAGYVAQDDAQAYIGFIVALVSGGFAVWNNRQKRLAEKAAATGMTVIAPAQIADNSKSSNVVSSAENMVVPK